jgi:hypothetical protein
MTEPLHYTNAATKGMPHEALSYRCWCLDSENVLRAELGIAQAKDEAMMSRLTYYCDLSDKLEAEVERLQALEAIVREHIEHREPAYRLKKWLRED